MLVLIKYLHSQFLLIFIAFWRDWGELNQYKLTKLIRKLVLVSAEKAHQFYLSHTLLPDNLNNIELSVNFLFTYSVHLHIAFVLFFNLMRHPVRSWNIVNRQITDRVEKSWEMFFINDYFLKRSKIYYESSLLSSTSLSMFFFIWWRRFKNEFFFWT